MESIDVLIVIGLVGITLAISVGKWLNGFKQWLLGFEVWINPLRIFGELVSCTVSVGFFVGFFWSIGNADPWKDVFVMGGVVSFASYVADEILALMDAGVRKLMGGGRLPPMPFSMGSFQEKSKDKKTEVRSKPIPLSGESRPLSEEEAHSMIGGGENE